MATFRDVNGGDLDDAARRNDHKLAKWVTQNTVPTAGFRNVIINGGFDVWQRTTSATVTNAFGYISADRWQVYGFGTGASATLARFIHGTGSSEPYGGLKFYANYNWTAGSDTVNGICLVQNVIEDVRTLSGQEVTVSFWANSGSGTPSLGIELEQVFGTGGSPSASVQGISKKVMLTTSPTRYVVTFKLPSIAGKTIGSNEDSSLRLNFWTSAGSTYNGRTGIGIQASGSFNVWGVQLEAGRVATPFERRPYGVELSLCQRYYQRFGGGSPPYENLASGICYAAGTSVVVFRQLAVRMRAIPTLSWDPTAGNFIITNDRLAWSPTSLAQGAQTSPDCMQILVGLAAGPTVDLPYSLRPAATSSWIAASAEL